MQAPVGDEDYLALSRSGAGEEVVSAMLSNFASKKSDKEGIPVSGEPAAAVPPPIQREMPQQAAPRPPAGRAAERSQPSVIGPDLTIMGNLTSNGEVHVDGEVQGDVHATHVVIGEGARVTGGIMAREIVVRGHIVGFLRGHKVLLQATSHVEGDVLHKSLAIEQGAFFEGKSRRSEEPLADGAQGHRAPPPPAQPATAQPAAVQQDQDPVVIINGSEED
jgi:cytoskeletal protein CcmA (bactofilin family)